MTERIDWEQLVLVGDLVAPTRCWNYWGHDQNNRIKYGMTRNPSRRIIALADDGIQMCAVWTAKIRDEPHFLAMFEQFRSVVVTDAGRPGYTEMFLPVRPLIDELIRRMRQAHNTPGQTLSIIMAKSKARDLTNRRGSFDITNDTLTCLEDTEEELRIMHDAWMHVRMESHWTTP